MGYVEPRPHSTRGDSYLACLDSRYFTLDLAPCDPAEAVSYLPLRPRSTLSALSDLTFYGSGEYLDDLITRIDIHSLLRISLHYWHWVTDAPRLRQMVCRRRSEVAQSSKNSQA